MNRTIFVAWEWIGCMCVCVYVYYADSLKHDKFQVIRLAHALIISNAQSGLEILWSRTCGFLHHKRRYVPWHSSHLWQWAILQMSMTHHEEQSGHYGRYTREPWMIAGKLFFRARAFHALIVQRFRLQHKFHFSNKHFVSTANKDIWYTPYI